MLLCICVIRHSPHVRIWWCHLLPQSQVHFLPLKTQVKFCKFVQQLDFFLNEFFKNCIWIGVLLTSICAPCAHLLPSEFRKGHEIPLECGMVLSHHGGTGDQHPPRAVSAVNCRAISSTPAWSFFENDCLPLRCTATCSLMSRWGVVF